LIGGDATVRYRRGPRDLRVVAALAIVALALAACSDSPSSTSTTTTPPTTTTPSTSTSTTTATDAEDAAVLTAYRAAWAAYEQATKTANPLDSALSATMVDPVLEQVKKKTVSYEVGGIIGKGSLTLHPHVASLSATSESPRDSWLLVRPRPIRRRSGPIFTHSRCLTSVAEVASTSAVPPQCHRFAKIRPLAARTWREDDHRDDASGLSSGSGQLRISLGGSRKEAVAIFTGCLLCHDVDRVATDLDP
jgi:hypothetical protein